MYKYMLKVVNHRIQGKGPYTAAVFGLFAVNFANFCLWNIAAIGGYTPVDIWFVAFSTAVAAPAIVAIAFLANRSDRQLQILRGRWEAKASRRKVNGVTLSDSGCCDATWRFASVYRQVEDWAEAVADADDRKEFVADAFTACAEGSTILDDLRELGVLRYTNGYDHGTVDIAELSHVHRSQIEARLHKCASNASNAFARTKAAVTNQTLDILTAVGKNDLSPEVSRYVREMTLQRRTEPVDNPLSMRVVRSA